MLPVIQYLEKQTSFDKGKRVKTKSILTVREARFNGIDEALKRLLKYGVCLLNISLRINNTITPPPLKFSVQNRYNRPMISLRLRRILTVYFVK